MVALPFLLFMILFRVASGVRLGKRHHRHSRCHGVAAWPASPPGPGANSADREEGYVQAARLLGAPQRYLIFRHMIPNTLGVILVTLTLPFPRRFSRKPLSFIGMGVAPHAVLGLHVL